MKTKSTAILGVAAALFLAACDSGSGSPDLTGVVWQWTSLERTAPGSQSVVPNPADYTITFEAGGSAAIRADCNMVEAFSTVDGSNLTIKLGASTLAYCGDDSSDVIFLSSLTKVASYTIEGDTLSLVFPNAAGQMRFDNGGSP